MDEHKSNGDGGTGATDIDELAALAEQTTQSACSAVLLTARELIKSHDQKFAIEQIMALSEVCDEASQQLEVSQDFLDRNDRDGAHASLNRAIENLMNVSNSALSADTTATRVASNDTALFRSSRK